MSTSRGRGCCTGLGGREEGDPKTRFCYHVRNDQLIYSMVQGGRYGDVQNANSTLH
jgi:hypothetical protein